MLDFNIFYSKKQHKLFTEKTVSSTRRWELTLCLSIAELSALYHSLQDKKMETYCNWACLSVCLCVSVSSAYNSKNIYVHRILVIKSVFYPSPRSLLYDESDLDPDPVFRYFFPYF